MSDFSISTRDTRTEVYALSGAELNITHLQEGDEVTVRFISGETGGNRRVDIIPRARVERADNGSVRFAVQLNADWHTRYERKLYMGDAK